MTALAPEAKHTDHAGQAIPVAFFVRGEVVTGDAVKHRSRDLGVEFAR